MVKQSESNSVELISKTDMKWQGGLILGLFVFIGALLVAVDLDGARRRAQTRRLIDGLINGEHIESDLWLWVARIVGVIVVIAFGYYMLRVKPKANR